MAISHDPAHHPSNPAGGGIRPLVVSPEEVVQLVEASDGRLVAEGAVWSAVIVGA
jgi:hypothetical protein